MSLTRIMLGCPENAKIGDIHYLCYGNKCWCICRSIIATFRKYIICWSRDLICINLHIIKKSKFSVDVLVGILT